MIQLSCIILSHAISESHGTRLVYKKMKLLMAGLIELTSASARAATISCSSISIVSAAVVLCSWVAPLLLDPIVVGLVFASHAPLVIALQLVERHAVVRRRGAQLVVVVVFFFVTRCNAPLRIAFHDLARITHFGAAAPSVG